MIAFTLPGGLPVYAFSLLIALGLAGGLAWIAWQAPAADRIAQLYAGLWVAAGALFGARAVYVAFRWPYFREHLWESPQVFLGGLAWPGAVAGGWLALALYARWRKVSFLRLADHLLPLVACLGAAAWLGCWFEGCAYGAPTGAPWGLPARDLWGETIHRRPIQLLGAALTVLIFWLIERGRRRLPRPGQAAGLGLLGLSLQLLFLGALRADPAPLWLGWRADLWAGLFFSLLGAGTFLRASQRPLPGQEPLRSSTRTLTEKDRT